MSTLRAVGRRWEEAYALFILAFLFVPITFIALFSVDKRGLSTFPITGLTTRWYRQFFSDPVMTDAAIASLKVAAATALVTSVIGGLASFALVRYRVRLAGAFTGLMLLPIVVPALLLGVALLSFFSKLGIQLSLLTVTIGHILVTLPFFVLTINARVANLDRSLEEAAAVLGATPLQRFRHVTFPLLRPSLIAASLLVVAISLDEFVVTFFTAGTVSTLPVVIWGQMRAGVSPVVDAVSTLMLIVIVAIVLAVRRLSGVRFS